jgi:hypothetical protein
MRKVLLAAAIVALGMAIVTDASALGRQAVRYDGQGGAYGLASDCTLQASNTCSGWIWTFVPQLQGTIWGSVLNSADCAGGCAPQAAVSSISVYSRCSTTPGSVDGFGISTVDATGCLTGVLYDSGPVTVVHCVVNDRWTTFDVSPLAHVYDQPFAVTITWGPVVPGGTNNPQFATDNGIGNLFCSLGTTATFPGCATTALTCAGWTVPAQNTFIYVADFNGDTILDDICALYGAPYPLSFPYFYPYGYLPNNLVIEVGLSCGGPTAVEHSTWGQVKALYE